MTHDGALLKNGKLMCLFFLFLFKIPLAGLGLFHVILEKDGLICNSISKTLI